MFITVLLLNRILMDLECINIRSKSLHQKQVLEPIESYAFVDPGTDVSI